MRSHVVCSWMIRQEQNFACTVHLTLSQTLTIFYCCCILYCSSGEEASVYFLLSAGLETVKWSKDRVIIYLTLVTVHLVDASLGPVGFYWRHVHTSTDHWCVLFWVTLRDNTFVYLQDGWKISEAEVSSTYLLMFRTWRKPQKWIPSILGVFQTEDIRHSCDMWSELHHAKSPSAAKHDPLSHNMSDIHSTKEWSPTASSPFSEARNNIHMPYLSSATL